jgi:hypothetical protein
MRQLIGWTSIELLALYYRLKYFDGWMILFSLFVVWTTQTVSFRFVNKSGSATIQFFEENGFAFVLNFE